MGGIGKPPMILGLVLAQLLPALAAVTVCPEGCDFASPAAAVSGSPAGSIIRVKAGEYAEQKIVIDRSVTLIGENMPVLAGTGTSDVITITAPDVSVSGFKIAHSGMSFTSELAGIRVESTKGAKIRENAFVDDTYGVYLANSEDCVVQNNSFVGTYLSESESGNGIHSWSGKNHRIIGNIISRHRDGIYLEFTQYSKVIGNTAAENVRYGLHFMSSNNNLYEDNRFELNGAGVAVMYSKDIVMHRNYFANNRGMASYGLLLKDISRGQIYENVFVDNTYGVYMEGTLRSRIFANQFTDNGCGLRIFADCEDNRLERNNFSGNTFDVTTNSSHNPNTFSGNYWSKYQGYDLNRDGVGDTPYRPVALSSVIVDRLDASYVLIKSPLLQLLDQIEQTFPLLIPESLKDERPLIAPWSGDK